MTDEVSFNNLVWVQNDGEREIANLWPREEEQGRGGGPCIGMNGAIANGECAGDAPHVILICL